MKPLLEERMRGQLAGKTMYVIPYLMSPPGSPLERYAAGVELTDNRTVVLHMIRMARVGIDLINNLAEPDMFVRAVHVTGDLEKLGQGTPNDQRISSPSPTSGRSSTSARRTAATRCSARSPTASGRRPTTAGPAATSSPSSSC